MAETYSWISPILNLQDPLRATQIQFIRLGSGVRTNRLSGCQALKARPLQCRGQVNTLFIYKSKAIRVVGTSMRKNISTQTTDP